MSAVTVGRLKALIAVLIWGGSFPATRAVMLGRLSPDTLIWLRLGSGFLALTAYLLTTGRLRRLPARTVLAFAGLGFIGVFLHNVIQAVAMQTTSAGFSGLITAANPIAIAILGWLILGERLSARKKGGILLATAGVLLLLSKGSISTFLGLRISFGELLMLMGIVTWGLFSVLSRKALVHVDPGLATGYALGFGWFYATMLLIWTGGYGEIASIATPLWGNILFLGVFCSGAAYVLWYDALSVLPVSEAGVFLYINPVVAVLLSALLLGERVTAPMILGGLLIFSGVWFVNRSAYLRLGRGSISYKE